MGIPRGERYEMCRSVHAEANSIIAADRDKMIGSVLYMCCTDPGDGAIMPNTCSCMMCKRMVINAGIEKVIVREDKDTYTEYAVSDWIENDDSLSGKFGY
ncbi:MAG: cytidine deaminase, partial [Clostridia bacterium]|nr:cytidine deaminase [Clostridia bacterium]